MEELCAGRQRSGKPLAASWLRRCREPNLLRWLHPRQHPQNRVRLRSLCRSQGKAVDAKIPSIVATHSALKRRSVQACGNCRRSDLSPRLSSTTPRSDPPRACAFDTVALSRARTNRIAILMRSASSIPILTQPHWCHRSWSRAWPPLQVTKPGNRLRHPGPRTLRASR